MLYFSVVNGCGKVIQTKLGLHHYYKFYKHYDDFLYEVTWFACLQRIITKTRTTGIVEMHSASQAGYNNTFKPISKINTFAALLLPFTLALPSVQAIADDDPALPTGPIIGDLPEAN